VEVDAAYQRCEEITGSEARNFSYGIRLLPTPKRQAMSALYALARRIDDIGDGTGPADERLAALAVVRSGVAKALADPASVADDAVLVALADTAKRYPIPIPAIDELIQGCELDVAGTQYATIDDLVGYCRKVAGTVGRLSLGVFGTADPATAEPLADALGVALQLTNICRDIAEDRDQMGRIYLPQRDIERFECRPDLSGPEEAVIGLLLYETARAQVWYEEGLQLLPMLDRRSRACTAAMAGIYRRLLDRIRRDPAAVLRSRMSLPTWEKAWVAARSLSGAGV
jgi:15-cis-phytoene synthase